MELSLKQIESKSKDLVRTSLDLGHVTLQLAAFVPKTIIGFAQSGRQGQAFDSDFKPKKSDEITLDITMNGDGVYVPPIFEDAINLFNKTGEYYEDKPQAYGILPEDQELAS